MDKRDGARVIARTLFCCGGVLFASSAAQAAGFGVATQNGSGLGNAYAGQSAAAADASTIFYNPAGMTRVRGIQVVQSLAITDVRGEFNDEGSTPPAGGLLGQPLGGDGGDPGGLSLIPAGYVSWEIMPNSLWLGIGLGAPFGNKTEWDSDWMGRFHATSSDIKTLNLNPSIAWRVNEKVSVGAGFNVQKIDAELKSQANYAAVGALLGIPLAGAEGQVKVDGDDIGFGWNVGVMFELDDFTRVGLAYRSKIKYDIEGDVRFRSVPPAIAAVPALRNGKVKAEVEMPDSFSVAAVHRLSDRIELLADYTWTGWDSIQDLSIYRDDGAGLTSTPLRFQDSWRVGLGANYQFSESIKFRVGMAYDKTPVRDRFRTPRLPDGDRIWLALGMQWKLNGDTTLDVGYAHQWVDEAKLNLPDTDPANTPAGFSDPPRGALRGKFEGHIDILGVQLTKNF